LGGDVQGGRCRASRQSLSDVLAGFFDAENADASEQRSHVRRNPSAQPVDEVHKYQELEGLGLQELRCLDLHVLRILRRTGFENSNARVERRKLFRHVVTESAKVFLQTLELNGEQLLKILELQRVGLRGLAVALNR
jgi:hypothetical protein